MGHRCYNMPFSCNFVYGEDIVCSGMKCSHPMPTDNKNENQTDDETFILPPHPLALPAPGGSGADASLGWQLPLRAAVRQAV